MDVLAPNPEGQIRALERAYEEAAVSPDSIGYLEAHGTGTAVGDLAELKTIKRFFGESEVAPTDRAMGSVKSMIGHTMPAAGMASLIRVALALSNKLLPPSLHCEEPHPELAGVPFFLNTETRPWVQSTNEGPRRAGINAFGFGGINVHAVLEEVPVGKRAEGKIQVPVARPIVPGLDRATELVALGGKDMEDLKDRLEVLKRFLETPSEDSSLVDLAFTLTTEVDLSAPSRLAFVARDMDDLRGLVDESVRRLENLETDGGEDPFPGQESIFFSADASGSPGKVACLLPGMGLHMAGSYPANLMRLAMHFPMVREEFDFFETRGGRSSMSAMFAPPAHLPEEAHQELKLKLTPPNMASEWSVTGSEQHDLAMTVTLANWAVWVLLKQLDLPVDMMAGQSQGEVTALCAAGVADFHEVMPKVWDSLTNPPDDPELHDRIWAGLRDSRLCFVWADEETVQPYLDEAPGTHLSICMTPQSVVIGGPQSALTQVVQKLRDKGIFVHLLPFPPIHSPVLAPLRERMEKDAREDDSEKRPPTITLYSSVTTEPYPDDPDRILDTLMLNLDHPLRLWQTVRRMHADGARVFVQLGGRGLVGHIESWLDEPEGVLAVTLDTEARDAITQLNQMCAKVWTAGVPVRLGALFDWRNTKRLDLGPRAAGAGKDRPPLLVPLRLDWTPLSHPSVPPREARIPSEGPTAAGTGSTGGDGAEPAGDEEPTFDVERVLRDSGMPFVGRVDAFEPGRELLVTRTLDLDEDLFLLDHPFVHAPGLKPPEELLPILAMSFITEMVGEIAAGLSPGQGLIGFENIRASRWIGLRDVPRTDVQIGARLSSVDQETGVRRVDTRVEFEEKESYSATVLFADSYRCDLLWQIDDPVESQAWPWAAEEVYGTRRMFHGPAFQCVSDLTRFGNPISEAELEVLPKDRLFASTSQPNLLIEPCLVDGLAQIIGLWAQAYGWFVLPTGIEKLEVYCPTPPIGTRVKVRVELVEFDLDTKQLACRFEVEDGEGGIWMRAEGWRDWIFKWSERFVEFLRVPAQQTLGEEVSLPGLPGDAVCVWLDMSDVWHTDLDWAARVILHSQEFWEFKESQDGGDEQLKKQHVWSRAAVKDAARSWAASRKNGSMAHPASLILDHEDGGRPRIRSAFAELDLPHVSLSHKDRSAIALATSVPVGIDFEPADRDLAHILSQFATEDEIELLARPGEDLDAGYVRLWCAKEAVAKCLGTGLGGRPKDFVAREATGDGVFEMEYQPTGQRMRAVTTRFRDWIVAYAWGSAF